MWSQDDLQNHTLDRKYLCQCVCPANDFCLTLTVFLYSRLTITKELKLPFLFNLEKRSSFASLNVQLAIVLIFPFECSFIIVVIIFEESLFDVWLTPISHGNSTFSNGKCFDYSRFYNMILNLWFKTFCGQMILSQGSNIRHPAYQKFTLRFIKQ